MEGGGKRFHFCFSREIRPAEERIGKGGKRGKGGGAKSYVERKEETNVKGNPKRFEEWLRGGALCKKLVICSGRQREQPECSKRFSFLLPSNIALNPSLFLFLCPVVARLFDRDSIRVNERSISVSTIRWLNRLNLSPGVCHPAMGLSGSRVRESEDTTEWW